MEKLKYYWSRITEQKNPVKFILSRLLLRTRICQILIIDRGLYKVRFFPSSVSIVLWEDPGALKEDEKFLSSYLKEGDVFIDIGANIGTLTLTAASLVGKTGLVVSVEAHPRTFSFLKKNVLLNNFNNIKLFNTAIGEKEGTLYFTNKRSDDQNEVSRENKGIKIIVKKLDDLINPDLQIISLLKVDVEGYEKFVFLGSEGVLKKTQCIYYESNEKHFNKYSYTTQDVIKLLAGYGFSIFKLNNFNALEKVGCDYKSVRNENLLAIKNINDFLERTGYVLRQ